MQEHILEHGNSRSRQMESDAAIKKKISLFSDIAKNKASYLLALPAMIYTFIFGYMTYPYILIAFQHFNYRKGILDSEWIGFKNFEFFFKSNNAYLVTWNTIKLNLLFIGFGTLFAVGIALILNEIKSRSFLKISQAFMLFPHYISWVVISYILYALLSMDLGMINHVLQTLGLSPVNWYTKPEVWPPILTIMRVWKGTGMSAVIYLAAITGIDESLYESAQIDGANRWQQCIRITIPLIMPTVAILTLMNIGKIMHGDFGMIYAIIKDNGVLYPTTDVIDTYVFRSLRLVGDPSEAMAVSLFQSAIGFVMVFGTNWLARRYFKEGALY